MYSAQQPKTKCDIVVDEILSMIAKGVYKENDKLPPERYFVEYFGMSRVTIRESFKKLSMLGVVRIKQGEGTFVNKVDLGTVMQPLFSSIVLDNLSIAQIYDSRLFIESGMARLAARNVTDAQAEKLDELIQLMEVETANQDADRFSQLDIVFHAFIAEISENHILIATYKTIKDILSKYITTSNLSSKTVAISQEYHRAIVDAIKSHDEQKAGSVMEEHVRITKESLLARVQAGEGPLYIK